MTSGKEQPLFDARGRRTPFAGMRVYSRVASHYYQLRQPAVDCAAVLDRTSKHTKAGTIVPVEKFKTACDGLLQAVKDDASLSNLLKGVHVPFVCPKISEDKDLGGEFENDWLPAVSSAFTGMFPKCHFKATVQGESELGGNVRVAEGSRYEHFLQARRVGAVVGWYFPEALLGYDVASQRSQMTSLTLPENLVLSGGFDVAAALIGTPDLLVNEDAYPPVLCLSGFQHADTRLMLCFKAYGLSLEFWGLSQMLTPTTTQVSEQWAGGLTIFTVVK